MSLRFIGRHGRMLAAVSAVVLALAPAVVDARPGGGKSSGSRGSNTYSAPPSTNTSPGAAQPMQRSMTPNTGAPASPTQPGINATRPAAAAPAAQAAKPSFARNLMMGLGAGLLGAGLFGLLSGSGLFGGLGGIASFIGLLLQAALIAGIIMLAIRFFRRRSEAPQPALAGAAVGGMNREAYAQPQPQMAMGGGAAPQERNPDGVGLGAADFDVFEKRLHGVMDAYSREDLASLRKIATPEMVGYFAEDLADNARNGVVDVTRDVKLLQGDLSEAWREGNQEYATVAMRFGFINTVSERNGGKVVEGNATTPQEATEIWTFLRTNGGEWLVSAIQQTA